VQREMTAMMNLTNHQMDHHQLEDHHLAASFLASTTGLERYYTLLGIIMCTAKKLVIIKNVKFSHTRY